MAETREEEERLREVLEGAPHMGKSHKRLAMAMWMLEHRNEILATLSTPREPEAWRYKFKDELEWTVVRSRASVPEVLRYPPKDPPEGLQGTFQPLYAAPPPDSEVKEALEEECGEYLREVIEVLGNDDLFAGVRVRAAEDMLQSLRRRLLGEEGGG